VLALSSIERTTMRPGPLTTPANRAHRPLSDAQGQESTGPDARAAINAGLAPPIATHLLVATCETRCVVSRAVVETVDPRDGCG
jgi:hypothetical protein